MRSGPRGGGPVISEVDMSPCPSAVSVVELLDKIDLQLTLSVKTSHTFGQNTFSTKGLVE